MSLPETLSTHPLFSDRSRKELRRAAQLMTELHLPAGRTLMREGTVGREFMVVLDGDLDVSDRDVEVSHVHGGSFVGELSLLTGAHRTATVTTTVPTHVLVMNRHEFALLLDELPTVGMRIAHTALRRQLELRRN
ncbi:MAG: cyclic nucleotide-binding domain-containing protein [Acidimicrobiales bacterium]|nr:cyclic nucleotide-binding domain-containing protein [Acidimicrobiales bacterium]